MTLTDKEIDTLIVIERVTASISVTGTLLLLSTFIFIKEFRTLSNTLIFYASFANLFANVAALIGGSALSQVNGALCQFQGFLLELFMQSDPLWSCAMAVNVYLVFFRRYDAFRLKKLYWIYAIICYGLPFIPAMVCLLYRTSKRGKIYGNATLWCWIDNDWAALRIYSYYAPIWVSILVALLIYVRVGFEIFQKRSQLRGAMSVGERQPTVESAAAPPEPTFTGLRTTEVEVVTTNGWDKPVIEAPPEVYSRTKETPIRKNQYTITITGADNHANSSRPTTLPRRPSPMDRIKWAYTRCAMLFAISILITWVPASANRVYGLRYPKNPSFALNAASAFVLPLQGFWNTIIYFTTSLTICKDVIARFREKKQQRGFTELGELRDRRKKGQESDSTVQLSRARSVGSLTPSL